jgi:hypothetical protein
MQNNLGWKMTKLVWFLKGYQGNGVFLAEVRQAPDFIQEFLFRKICGIDPGHILRASVQPHLVSPGHHQLHP